MSQADLQVELRRFALRIYELVMVDVNQLLANIVVGGKVPAGVISGSNPATGLNVLTTQGDLLTFNGTVYVRLPIGFTGQVLTVLGGVPVWANNSGSTVGGSLTDDSSVDLIDDSGNQLVSD